MNVGTVTMKKIVVKKRHSIRKSQAQDLLSRLFDQIGDSAKLFHADMIEVLETNADVSLFMVHKKPLLMDTGNWVFPTLKGAIQFPFPERRVVVDAGAIPVSYTHLRAHETGRNLVCRLLLEKKKK